MTRSDRGLGLFLVTLCLVAGCAKQSTSLDATYGKRRGFPGGKSVNGTAVLCHMFDEAGFRVTSARRLSRGVEAADAVVWTPSDFELPDQARQDYFNQWLSDGYERTVVFIGRDFDAAIDYWDHMVKSAQPKESIDYRRQLAKAKAGWHGQRQDNWLGRNACEWFDWDFDRPTRTIEKISGPWSKGVNASQLDLKATAKLLLPNDSAHRKRLRSKRQRAKKSVDRTKKSAKSKSDKKADNQSADSDKVESDSGESDEVEAEESAPDAFDDSKPLGEELNNDEEAEREEGESEEGEEGIDEAGEDAESIDAQRDRWNVKPLLKSGDEILAARISRPHWGDSRIIVITNGSWLLNMPLVNHEHRKLAGKLIEECDGRKVVFLEADANPYISDGEEGHPFLHAFRVSPLQCILLHLTTLGIVYCFSVFPVFGRPTELPQADLSDFGKHLTAFGALLSKTEDQQYARRILKTYRHKVDKDVPEEAVAAAANPFKIAAASQSGNPFQPAGTATATTPAEPRTRASNAPEEPT